MYPCTMARTQRRVDLAKKKCPGKKCRAKVKTILNQRRQKSRKAPAKRVEIETKFVLTNRLRTRKSLMAPYFSDKRSEIKQREHYPIEDLLFKFRSNNGTSQLLIARWKQSEVMAPYISDECKAKFNKRIKQGKPYEPKPDWERVKTVILSYQNKQIKVIRTESFLYNYAFPVEDIVSKVDDENDKYLIEWQLAILAEEVVKSGQYIGELYKFNESNRQALMEAELSANGVEFRNQVYVPPTVEDPDKGNVKENDGGIEALVDNLSFDLNNYAGIVDKELKEKDTEVHEEEDMDEESEKDHVEEVYQVEEVDKVDDENQNEEMDQGDDEDQNTEVDEENEVHQEDEVEEEYDMNQNSEMGQNAEVAQENQDIMEDRANVHVQVEAIIEQINVDLVIEEVPVLRDHHIDNIENIENIENRRDIELIDWEEPHNSFVVGDHNWNWIVHAFGLMEDNVNDDDPLLPTDNDPFDGNEQHGVFEISREEEIRVVDDEVPIDPLDMFLNANVQRDPLYQTFEQLMYNT